MEVAQALRGTVVGVVAVGSGGAVGCGRVVGDGAFYNLVVDLIVRPETQSMGVGRRLLSTLERELSYRSATGVLQLIAYEAVTPFYERCGYERSESNLLAKRLR